MRNWHSYVPSCRFKTPIVIRDVRTGVCVCRAQLILDVLCRYDIDAKKFQISWAVTLCAMHVYVALLVYVSTVWVLWSCVTQAFSRSFAIRYFWLIPGLNVNWSRDAFVVTLNRCYSQGSLTVTRARHGCLNCWLLFIQRQKHRRCFPQDSGWPLDHLKRSGGMLPRKNIWFWFLIFILVLAAM